MTMLTGDAHALYDPVRTPFEVDERDFPVDGAAGGSVPVPAALRDSLAVDVQHAAVAFRGERKRYRGVRRLHAPHAGGGSGQPRVAAEHRCGRGDACGSRLCILDFPASSSTIIREAATVPWRLRFLTPVAAHPVSDAVRARLFPAITRRRTNRQGRSSSRAFRARRWTRSGIGCRTSELADGLRRRPPERNGGLPGRRSGHASNCADQAYRDDMSAWIHADTAAVPDGIPANAAGPKGVPPAIASWAVRAVDNARQRAATGSPPLPRSAGTGRDSSEDTVPHWLDAGELLQEVLLTAEHAGLACSYFNMPMHVPEIRARLRALLGVPSWPQLLLRIGYCLEETPRTPRRPLEDVLVPTTTV